MKDHLAKPQELGIHTLDDVRAYDRFVEFVLGNGEMRARVDALHSQHLNGANKRAAPAIHIVDAWGDPAFPYFRNRPAGIFVSHLIREDGPAVGLEEVVEYRQALDLETATLATDYAWKAGEALGHCRAEGFMSHANRHLMVHRYDDRAEGDGFFREFAVKTRVPYHTRSLDWVKDLRNHLPPKDARIEVDRAERMATIRFSLRSPVWQTEIVWAVGCLGVEPEWRVEEEEGAVVLRWPLGAASKQSACVISVILTDRDCKDPVEAAREQVRAALKAGYGELHQSHVEAWRREWCASSLRLPDPHFQRLWEVSRYHLLCNVGGSYWGNIAVDEYGWDTHMLDSMISAHALLETGNVDLIRRHLARLDGRYLKNARQNAREYLEKIFGQQRPAEAAMLPGFLSENGRANLYPEDHSWLHGPQVGTHVLALLKAAAYSMDEEFLRDLAYPWIRGFAEYARAISVRDPKLGYIYPVGLSGTVGDLHWSQQVEAGSLDGPSFSHLDAVLTYQRVLETAASLARDLGRDEDLAQRWLEVADNLYIPQDQERLLWHSHDDGVSEEYLPGPMWGLFWPNEWMFRRLPEQKVRATLANYEPRRNRQIICWNSGFAALAHAYLGDGDGALELAREFFAVCDERMIQMRDNTGPIPFFGEFFAERGAVPSDEPAPGYVYYYDLSYATYLLIIRNLLLQDQPGGELLGFPAVPGCWEDVEFSNFPASGGRRVSGRWSQGKGQIEVD